MLSVRSEPKTVTLEELVASARRLRGAFAETAAAVDRAGEWPRANLDLLKASGFHALRVPVAWGGIAPEVPYADMAELVEMQIELAAGEPGTAHVWHQNLFSRDLFSADYLPDETKRTLARDILDEGVGLCAPISEAGRTRYAINTRCAPAKGGVTFNGTKKYGTGSEGARYALVAAPWEDGSSGLHFGLIRLDADGVTNHHDWDAMGQRTTCSHTFTYDNVFVPDGWHWHVDPQNGRTDWTGSTVLGLVAQLFFTAAILGSGVGALDAMRDVIRTKVRPVDPSWASAAEDPSIRHAAGRYSAVLAAARAATMEAAREFVSHVVDGTPRSDVSLKMMQAKIAATDAALEVSSDMFRSCGATAASRTLGLDRFWRNARTISLQDPIDVKYLHLGDWVLSGVTPPMSSIT